MVAQVSVTELARWLRTGSDRLLLLDVREPGERVLARIEPSLHIPMDEVESRFSELPVDRKIVVYCHYGNRSLAVASYLESEGYADVLNLSGGIDAWSQKVDPSIPRYS